MAKAGTWYVPTIVVSQPATAPFFEKIGKLPQFDIECYKSGDGDFIFVCKRQTAERGEIVVAMIEDEATVKRYYPEGEVIRLQPANETMAPTYVHENDISIQGVVVGVLRRY